MIALLVLMLQTGAALSPAPPALAVRAGSAEKMVPLVQTNTGGALPIQALDPVVPVRVSNPQRGRFIVSLPGFEFEARDQIPYIVVNGQVHQLAAAPHVAGGRLHVPFQLVAELLPRIAPQQFRYDGRRAELRHTATAAPQVAASSPVPVRTPPAAANAPRSSTSANAPAGTQSAGRNGLRRAYRVVVDAGHGGSQPGMIGSLGPGRPIREKEITLVVSLEVERLLKQRGVQVIMIRRTDVDIDFRERGRIANEASGDVFVSIHVNAANPAWRNASAARGFETYFLAAARTEDEKRVAAMENAAVGFESGAELDPNDPLGFLMRDMAQNAHLRESSDLAEVIQRNLARTHPGPNRGVKQAPFAVLVGAFMPAVLVEIGFGSNVAEARYMASANGRREIATAIADGIMEYLDHYDRRLGTAVR